MQSITFFSNDANIVAKFRKCVDCVNCVDCVQKSIDRNTNFDCDVIVSPSNSLGEIQGGIDLVYYEAFGGIKLQQHIYDKIKSEKNGELLIGHYLVINLKDVNIESPKYLILCPTMTVPVSVQNTRNAYYFCYALLDALSEINKLGLECKTVWCPIPAVGVGEMDPEHVGIQCRDALLARQKKGPIFDVHGYGKSIFERFRRVMTTHGVKIRRN